MLALFDMDGTLLPWDTQKFFCRHVLRRYPWRRLFLLVYVPLLPFAGVLGSEGLKRVFLSFLVGLTEREVNELAEEFVREWLPGQIWPEMRAILEEHQRKGDTTVLVSASPQAYVMPIGKLLGFTHVLGTVVDFPEDGCLPIFPDLINNKGKNKVVRLRELLGEGVFQEDGTIAEAHGYTDSIADLPMLRLCATNTCVNPRKRLTELAKKNGWQIIRLKRPWKSKMHRAWIRLKCVLGV